MSSRSLKSLLAASLLGVLTHAAVSQEAPHGDAGAGEKVFTKCKSCHQVGEAAKSFSGPELNGIIGRKAASVSGYTYSDAMKASGLTWDEASFRDYIKNPKAKVPGTKMAFSGLTKDKDIDDLEAYLAQYGADGKKAP
ncbi:MAG: c-type cytochrome [Janthinobacterium lividum]